MNSEVPSSEGRGARLADILALLLIAALAGILVSCTTVNATTAQFVGAPHYPPSDPASVQILRAEPTRPHERLGQLVLDTSTDPAPPIGQVEDKVRQAAAKIGADAAVIMVDRIQQQSVFVSGGYWDQTVEPVLGHKIVAVAIKYQLTPTGPEK